MTFGLYDTFANPQECHIIREALYLTLKLRLPEIYYALYT